MCGAFQALPLCESQRYNEESNAIFEWGCSRLVMDIL
jgi:hypothetical protein